MLRWLMLRWLMLRCCKGEHTHRDVCLGAASACHAWWGQVSEKRPCCNAGKPRAAMLRSPTLRAAMLPSLVLRWLPCLVLRCCKAQSLMLPWCLAPCCDAAKPRAAMESNATPHARHTTRPTNPLRVHQPSVLCTPRGPTWIRSCQACFLVLPCLVLRCELRFKCSTEVT